MITVIVLDEEKKVYSFIADAVKSNGYVLVDEPESGGQVKIVKKLSAGGGKRHFVIDLDEAVAGSRNGAAYRDIIPGIERPLIESALERAYGNKSRAAKLLGINRNTLDAKVKKFNIDPSKWKK